MKRYEGVLLKNDLFTFDLKEFKKCPDELDHTLDHLASLKLIWTSLSGTICLFIQDELSYFITS